MADQERVEQVVADLRAVVEEMAQAADERTKAAEHEAAERVSRYHDATDELAQARAQIARVEKERESIPNQAYRAGLDEDWQLEDELKERYKNLKPAIEAFRGQVSELEAEIATLVGPNPATPESTVYDAEITAYQRVRDAYAEVAGPLVKMQREVSAILRDPVDSLGAGERYWGQTLQGIRDVRLNDPAVREARAAKQQKRKQSRVRAIQS